MSEYPIRGIVFEAEVVRQKTPKTIVVKRNIVTYVKKYERNLIKTKKYAVHLPENMTVKVGDKILVGETRKISKTKNLVVIDANKR